MGAVTQEKLGELFGHDQTWVSRMQRRAIDPMPRDDREEAIAWGERLGLLGRRNPTQAVRLAGEDSASPAPAMQLRFGGSLKETLLANYDAFLAAECKIEDSELWLQLPATERDAMWRAFQFVDEQLGLVG